MNLNKDYKIQITTKPHYWDNKQKPFFWCIVCYYDKWCNVGSGWSPTLNEAFNDAYKYLNTHIEK